MLYSTVLDAFKILSEILQSFTITALFDFFIFFKHSITFFGNRTKNTLGSKVSSLYHYVWFGQIINRIKSLFSNKM